MMEVDKAVDATEIQVEDAQSFQSKLTETMKILRDTFNSGKTRSVNYRHAQLTNLKRLLEENEGKLCDALNNDLHKRESAVFSLTNLKRLLEENEGKLCDALNNDLHKPKLESLVFEVDFCKNDLVYCLQNLRKWTSPQKVSKTYATMLDSAYIHPDPLGVVLIISPWNYPIQLTLCPLIGAIAAGNCAVVKPSEFAPASGELLSRLLPKYLDEDCYRIINGGVEETRTLLEEKWDHIFYTGNSKVGRIVMSAAAKHLTPVTLELGGKNPVYVDIDSDLIIAARRIVWGKWVNCGQTCIAPDYILIHRSVQDKLVEEMKKALTEFYGESAKDSTDYCRIINTRHFERLKALLGGGTILHGGEVDEGSLYISPTIMADIDPASDTLSEEIFGPIIIIVNVTSVEQAVSYINQRDKPLALYAFVKDSSVIQKFVQETSSGSLVVNDTLVQASLHTLPFGGVGESGMGGYHGKFSFDTFSHKKSCVVAAQILEQVNRLRYPPYNDKKLTWIRRIV